MPVITTLQHEYGINCFVNSEVKTIEIGDVVYNGKIMAIQAVKTPVARFSHCFYNEKLQKVNVFLSV